MAITLSIGIGKDEKPFFSTSTSSKISTIREGKGKSILAFPEKYVVIDIETTGLSPDYDEIIEISAIRYEGKLEKSKYVSFVKPSFEIDEYITELTGITNEMLIGAPSIEQCIKEFKEFVGDDLLVGYNINFDINFLYDNLLACYGEAFGNDFVDVMRIARRTLPELPHHRQIDIADYYKIEVYTEHRAEADCRVCKACFDELKEDVERRNLDIFSRPHGGIRAKDISTEKTDFNTEHPLFGKVCVFTGTLEKMKRKEAMQIVADLGGFPGDGVTKKTNYLVLGNNDYCKAIKDGKSAKQKKAEKLILDGADLQIISEQVFYDMITEMI
ncbi:MAG: exonuclease [Lachnospiraceae bacterium]|nr:exonuclease [Lachnospiraceae bacterium]